MSASKTKRVLIVSGVLLFFFGFPLAGMLYVYFQAHSTMRDSALAFAEKEVPKIFRDRDLEGLQFFGTIEFRKGFDSGAFTRMYDRLGAFEDVGAFTVRRSTVTQRGEQMWQIVELRAPVLFARGEAELDLRLSRRSVALADWRIERWRVSAPDVE